MAGPDAAKPDAAAFAASEDGRAFIRGSGKAWGRAAIAGGADEDAARGGGGADRRVLHGE